MKKIKLVLTVLLMVLTIAGISAKNAHAAGEVAAWGDNDYAIPVQVLGLTNITSVTGVIPCIKGRRNCLGVGL